ncbi:hypothetical protein [Rhodococcus sp. MEB064]|uniref:hypothetical protein n=1 Tax=Rhodococcus sp. MEB064 TaxID=1587522 RepID=UPI0012E0894A|nr:hypothetical protein [Rhodococcus sp. MEB064]
MAVPDVTDSQNLLIAVIDAKTRKLVQYGTQPNNSGGLASFLSIVNSWVNRADTIVVVSGMNGIRNAGRDSLVAQLAASLGSSPLSRGDLDRMEVGAPFSMVGKAGADAGVAYTRVGTRVGDRVGGDITGLLRWNTTRDASRYDFTPPPPLTYSTRTEGDSGTAVTMTIGDKHYTSTPTGSDGFAIRGFDSQTLAPVYDTTVATSDPAGNRALSDKLVEVAARTDDAGRPYVVIVQSFGRPRPTPEWQAGADALVRLGGSRITFLSLDGASDYTLVGGRSTGPAAVEMGARIKQPGPAVGLLGLGHDYGYLPQISGPVGAVDTRQSAIMYQQPYTAGNARTPSFPAINADAEAYIGSQAGVVGCTPTSACSIREKFRTNYTADWPTFARKLAGPMTRPADASFSEADYETALTQLRKEVDYFNAVRTYFTATQNAMGLIRNDAATSAKTFGDEIVSAVDASTDAPVAQDGFKILSAIMGIALLITPELKAVWGPISAIYGLTSTVSGTTPGNAVANPVRVRAGDLSTRVQDALAGATYGFTSVAMVMVSDYGKLEAAYTEIQSERWKAPAADELLVDTKKGIKVWFAKNLVPLAYPWLVRGTPPGVGPTTVNALSCGTEYDNLAEEYFAYYPWKNMPANAQMLATWSFGAGGTVVPWNMFFTRNRPEMGRFYETRNSIGQGLANTLFGGGDRQLGIDLYDFMSPRYFGPEMHQANHRADRCDLF